MAPSYSHIRFHFARGLLHVGRLSAEDVDLRSHHAFAQRSRNGSEALALARGFAARFAGRDYFGSLRVNQTVVDRHHRLVFLFGGADRADAASDDASAAHLHLLVVAAENDNVASQQRVGAGNAADARAGALLHPVAGVAILLGLQRVDLGALDHDQFALLRDSLDQHGANALADILIGAEDLLHGGRDRRVIEFVDHDSLLLALGYGSIRGSSGAAAATAGASAAPADGSIIASIMRSETPAFWSFTRSAGASATALFCVLSVLTIRFSDIFAFTSSMTVSTGVLAAGGAAAFLGKAAGAGVVAPCDHGSAAPVARNAN